MIAFFLSVYNRRKACDDMSIFKIDHQPLLSSPLLGTRKKAKKLFVFNNSFEAKQHFF